MPRLNLIVLRFPDIERAAEFYTSFGLAFTKHAHGNGPEHYAADAGSTVLELYPETGEAASTRHVRLGFAVADPAAILAMVEPEGGRIVSALKPSPWGLRAVIDDPFGHRIEIIEEK